MSASLITDPSVDPVLAELIEQITDQFHAGQPLDLDACIQQHPDRADDLRRLWPALQMLAVTGSSAGEREHTDGAGQAVSGILGDFRILREVGRGGMGVVYEAEQISLSRRVALKMLPFASTLDSKQLQRFKNEAQAAAGLHHTNIVPVYATGCARGVHYYAMQLIEGQTLAALIRDLRQRQGRENREPRIEDRAPKNRQGSKMEDRGSREIASSFDPTPTGSYAPLTPDSEKHHQDAKEPTVEDQCPHKETMPEQPRSSIVDSRPSPFFRTVANLGIQAAEALEHAHELGVIHRDIKPANLMVDARGNLWITDFGLAHCQGGCELTMSGDLLGTLRYMSPEQALAKRAVVDERTDIYSLGITLYELLTLEAAFPGTERQEVLRQMAFDDPKPPRRFNKAIPMELETIVLKAMEKNPTDRYGTAKELANDLQRFLDDKPIRARRPTALHKVKKWARRNQAMVTTGLVSFAVLVVTVALVATVAAWRTENARQAESIAKNQAEDARKLAEARAEEIRSALDHLNTANGLMQSARFYMDMNQWAKAHHDLSEAVALRPDNSMFWFERAELYHRLCLWDLAAADFAKGFQLQDAASPRYWFHYALAEVYAGHPERYPEICARLRRHFDQGQNYFHQDNEIVRAYTLAPNPNMDIAWLLATAEKGVEREPAGYNHHALGLACYRAGKYEQALQKLRDVITPQLSEVEPFHKRSVDDSWYGASSNSVLALGLYRLGRTVEVRQALANAARNLDKLSEAQLRAPVGRGSHDTHDWLYCWMLFREAKAVVDGAMLPEDPRLWLMRGRGMAALGRGQAAAECYAKAEKLRPDDQQIRLAVLRGEHPPMIDREKLSAALAFFPFHVEAYYQRGLAYIQLGQFPEALADFHMAIALRPDHAGSYIQRGLIHIRRARFEEANANFSRVITLDSDPAKKATELANVLQDRWEDYQDVIDYLGRRARLAEQDDKLSPVQQEAAVQGCIRLVGKLAEGASKRCPEYGRGRTILAWFLGNYPDPRLRSPKLVLELAQRAVQYTPEDGWAWTALGLAHYRTASWKPAIEALQKGMPLRGGGDCNDWLLLAMTHWQLGHRAEALQWYGKASQWMESNYREDGPRFLAEAESLLSIHEQRVKEKENAEAKTPGP